MSLSEDTVDKKIIQCRKCCCRRSYHFWFF